VRIVAACNRDLSADVASGRFRADLFYRLNVFPIRVPPLRERREDITALANHFMQRIARKVGKPITRVHPETLRRLIAHDWPGNIRDLQNAIERAAVLADTPDLVVDWDLGPGVSGFANMAAAATAEGAGGSLQLVEKAHIIAVLRETQGVVDGPNGAAKRLKLTPSTTRFRMKKLGIRRADFEINGA
jgi:transcriptional regulator with GAF, ATPase, and Fis domain